MNSKSTVSRLGLKSLRSLIMPLSMTLLAACVLTVVASYRLSLYQLDEKIQRVGREYQSYLEELLWQYDLDSIDYQLQGFIGLDSIQYAMVRDGVNRFVEAGEAQADLSLPRVSIPLEYQVRDGVVESIGSLNIHASKAGIWPSVRQQVLHLVFIYIAVALIVSLLIMRQFNLNVLVPVLALASQLRNPSKNLQDLRLNLGREKTTQGQDELDELMAAIYQMRDQVLTTRQELRKGESRLAEAAKLAGLGYCTFDASMNRIVDCNQNYASFHGRSIESMRSLHVSKDIVETMLKVEDMARALESRQRIFSLNRDSQTYRINFDDGQFRHIRQSYLCKFDSQGTRIAIDCVAQDVTDEILKQEILVQSQKNDAVGKLTGGVAHDFNNILAVIQGNVEIVSDRISDSQLQRHLDTTLKAVAQGGRLTQQLLSFARRQPLSPKVLDVARMISDSAMLLQTSLGSNIHMEIVCDGGLWKTKADPVQLEAVILNLLVNARDAMDGNGTLILEVSNARLDHEYSRAHSEVEAGNYVCLSVTDSGCGMSQDIIEQAIEPFFTTKQIGKGTGLGLSMAYGFAKQSSGHLKIYSEPGYGTTIKLYLPKERSDIASVAPAVALEHRYELDGLKVFLIEDSKELSQMFTEQLETLGCIVHSAYDEHSALSLAREVRNIDVILSDIIIPGALNGRLLVKELSAFYPDANVIYMSGFTENSIVHNGELDEGIVFLQKPFRLTELARLLAQSRHGFIQG